MVLARYVRCALGYAGLCLCIFIGLGLGRAHAQDQHATERSPQLSARPGCALPNAQGRVHVKLEPVATGLNQPLYLTHAGDGSGRLFVVERTGLIRIIEAGRLLSDPFLDLSGAISTDVEEGLLSMAFHPDYRANGRFFVFFSTLEGHSVIAEHRVLPGAPNRAEPVGRRLLEVPQPDTAAHRGGGLAFGPDGYLYAALGNGGVGEESQNLETLLGTILRLDVDPRLDQGAPYRIPSDNPFVEHPSARAEIWAYGFRNPWRFSVDPCTGRLFAGDVGNAFFEEIDLVEPGGNYGFNFMEGSSCYVNPHEDNDDLLTWLFGTVCASGLFDPPIYDYGHLGQDPDGGNAVIGGVVYRGTKYPAFSGRYFFGDLASRRIWTLTETPDGAWRADEVLRSHISLVSFGEDEAGELYALDFRGQSQGAVYRIVPDDAPPN